MENRLIEITINDVAYVWDYRKGWVLKGSGEPLVDFGQPTEDCVGIIKGIQAGYRTEEGDESNEA